MKTDLVTIAIPVYERKDFFEEALNSALNQTVKCPIIVCDNASSHSYFRDLCSKYTERITYYKNDTNIGMFPNWNRCFQLAKTPYVVIFGDDDIMDVHFIESFLSYKKQFPDIEAYYTDYVYLDNNSKKLVQNEYTNLWGYCSMKDIIKTALNYGLGLPAICMVVNRQMMLDNPFEERIHGSNDWYRYYRFNDNMMFYGNKDVLMKYRKHDLADTKNKRSSYAINFTNILNMCDLQLRYGELGIWGQLKWVIKANNLHATYGKIFDDFIDVDSYYSDIYDYIHKKYHYLNIVSNILIKIRSLIKIKNK